jgi:hypothetical protein
MDSAGMGREEVRLVDGVVAELVALCPWMDGEDARMVREVVVAHFGLVAGEEVDLEVMAGALWVLAERAEAVGDLRRAWAFEQWSRWACAAMRGEEYHEPELPPGLTAMS